MSEAFTGEIKIFAGNFAPRGWALCDGQLLAVSQNEALFSLLGTIYGGDGRTTFGLPDLRGRIPIHQGTGPGLSPRGLGSKGGSENVTLTVNQLASHSHSWIATSAQGQSAQPQDKRPATAGGFIYASGAATALSAKTLDTATTGGSQRHTNIMPFQCVNYIVALFGIYPSRQ